MSGGQHGPDDRLRGLLRDRAARLAEPATADGPDTRAPEILVVTLGGQRFGLPMSAVAEIRHTAPPTPLPGAGTAWLGLINVRGEVLAVLDLGASLEVDPRPGPVDDRRFVLVSTATATVALSVDSVVGASAEVADLGQAPGSARRADARVVRGVTGDLVTVLDVERLLSDESLVG